MLFASLLLSAILFFGVALMLPTYFSLLPQKTSLKYQLAITQSNPTLKEIGEIEKSINDFNEKLARFEENEKKIRAVSPRLAEVLEKRPTSIQFRSITYKQDPRTGLEQFLIQGEARRRDDLLDFVEDLETTDILGGVDLPVTNLLKEADVDFTLTLDLSTS
jgi:Tfp pilus assembly protein PilN